MQLRSSLADFASVGGINETVYNSNISVPGEISMRHAGVGTTLQDSDKNALAKCFLIVFCTAVWRGRGGP